MAQHAFFLTGNLSSKETVDIRKQKNIFEMLKGKHCGDTDYPGILITEGKQKIITQS